MMDVLGARTLYIIAMIMAALWLYRLNAVYKKRSKSFDSSYEEMLTAEKYRVKGKFES